MDATIDEVRAYAGLPCEVPDALLTLHLAIAGRDLRIATGISDPVATLVGLPCAIHWTEAHIVRTLSSAIPYLHTFSLSGAAKAARLIGMNADMEFRFHTTDEVKSIQDRLDARYTELLTRIACDGRDVTEPTGAIYMVAI